MRFRKRMWAGLAIAAVACIGTTLAQQAFDHPTLKGGNSRQGKIADAVHNGPGIAHPRWSQPASLPVLVTRPTIDDTDQVGLTAVDGGPFETNPYGIAARSGNWQPVDDDFSSLEARLVALTPRIRHNAITVGTNTYSRNLNLRSPDYWYAFCTPSQASPYNPLVAATPANLRTFNWQFNGLGTTPRNYSVWVNIPVGPTTVRTSGQNVFPQQFYMYDIKYGPGANDHRVEKVDTYASSGGWVRLGGGGLPNTVSFPYDGTTPITITLYNTIPRTADTNQLQGNDSLVVYADQAMLIPETGTYDASPTTFRLTDADPNSIVVADARNELSVGAKNGNLTNVPKGVLSLRNIQDGGTTRWNYRPDSEGGNPAPNIYDDNSVSFDHSAIESFHGDGASTAAITDAATDPLTWKHSTYTSAGLGDETYAIYAYIPGNQAGFTFGKAVRYTITANGVTYGPYTLDESQPRGWVKLGDRRYLNIPATAGGTPEIPITVDITNASAEPTDIGKSAYADAIQFVGEADYRITSTPVYANVHIRRNAVDAATEGPDPLTKVIIVADENGIIHCLDAKGRTNAAGDPTGRAKEYWTYPSYKDSHNYDPNLGALHATGPDYSGDPEVPLDQRFPTAVMPGSFDLSSGLVETLTIQTTPTLIQKDYFFIGSSNGRVYCIDMDGAGNYDSVDPVSGGTRTAGTTSRVWTYPSTTPSPDATNVTPLRRIQGSVAYGEPNGVPTIFVAAEAGRIYALNALAQGDHSTTAIWQFPLATQPTLGPIEMTPAVAFNHVYFGTLRNPSSTDTAGQFYALNWTNGTLDWGYQGVGDFLSSPAVASLQDIDPTSATTDQGYVYAANQDGNVYAFTSQSATAPNPTIAWFSPLGSGAEASAEFTWQTVFASDLSGTVVRRPVVIIPTQDGHLKSLFAKPGDLDINGANSTLGDQGGSRIAGSFPFWGDSTRASVAVQGTVPTTDPTTADGTGWLLAADDIGFLYAFNNQNDNSLWQGQLPNEDIVPNDPRGNLFRKTKVKLISHLDYQRLRLPTDGVPDAAPTYAEAEAMLASTVNAFEWGQTAYILVYNFPYLTTSLNGNDVDPPVINVSFNVNGKTIRGIGVASRQFSNAGSAPTFNNAQPTTDPTIPALTTAQGGDLPMDGYAILAFPFQNTGANSLPPGQGEIQVSIQTSGLGTGNILQNVLLNNNNRLTFQVANPLGVYVAPTLGTLNVNDATNFSLPDSTNNFGIGLSTDPGNAENLINGAVGTKNLLGTGTPIAGHGTNAQAVIYVFDRSYMSLLRPDGLTQGLDGVRMDRRDLAWQGGAAAVTKGIQALYGAAFAGFEDLPTDFPNHSFDYPDIHAEQLSMTKDPNGSAENPLFSGIALRPPTRADGTALTEDTLPTDRKFHPTPVLINIKVPRFQPPNNKDNLSAAAQIHDSAGGVNQQGYMGRIDVFVDSVQNGRIDNTVREAYRSFNLSTAVAVDQRLSVTTPTIDLGTLPAGTGYAPGITPGTNFVGAGTPDTVFQPWFGNYSSIFKTFGVRNEGNVNLLNVRLAKISPFDRLRVGGDEHDPFNWLDGTFDVWSDIDPAFGVSPASGHPVILPKARVQDRVGTSLQSNPKRRENSNLGTTGFANVGGNIVDDVLNQTPNGTTLRFKHGTNPFSPVVGVSLPIGFPVGKYSQQVRVYEDNGDSIFDSNNGESFTEPGFTLSFNVSETQLTNSFRPLTSPMLDALAPNNGFWNSNVQPAAARDAFGSLIMAFASNRPAWNQTIGTPDTGNYRLYFSSLDSAASFSTNSNGSVTTTQGESPLRDLNFWNAASGSNWFKQGTGGYPSVPDASLFSLAAGETLVPNSVRYGNPSFPTPGSKDPFNANNYFSGMYMAFTGQAQKANPDNTIENTSRLMLGIVTPGADGSLSVSDPVVLPDNPQGTKGKPSVVQAGGSGTSTAIVFYPVTQSGNSAVMYTRYAPGSGFSRSQALPFGDGFSSVGSPSAVGRILRTGTSTAEAVIELTFQGKVRGRPNAEIYLGRLKARGAGNAVTANPTQLMEDANGNLDQANAFTWLTPETDENIVADNTPGTYRARGLYWDSQSTISLKMLLPSSPTPVDILVPGSGSFDQESKLISFSTRLGGKVYLDPMLGTVRFSNAVPSKNARLLLSYTPRFLRLSEGNVASYSDPVSLYDDRYLTDLFYWRSNTGANAGYGTQSVLSGQPLSNDRLVVTYNRAAVNARDGARPFMYSLRFGLRLAHALPTMDDGTPGFTNNSGAFVPAIANITFTDGQPNDAFQIDPVQGRVYFPSADEGRTVSIQYYAADSAGNIILDQTGNPMVNTASGVISLIAEHAEAPIPIETAINESSLVPVLDPFNYLNVNPASSGPVYRRPTFLWLFWASTRNGTQDIYFESLAPRWSPVPVR